MSLFLRDPRPATASPNQNPNPDAVTAEPYSTPRAITASGSRIRLTNRADVDALTRDTPDREWQQAAWNGYDHVGEVHFSANFAANLVARLDFFPAAVVDGNQVPQYVRNVPGLTPGLADAAERAMRRLIAPPAAPTSLTDTGTGTGADASTPSEPDTAQGGFSEFIRTLTINMFVPGEGYICQIPARLGPDLKPIPETWQARSVDEVITTGNPDYPVALRDRPGSPKTAVASPTTIPLPKHAFVARVWRRHPRFSGLADSSLKALTDDLEELTTISATFVATARSRLNSGILFVPDGLSASNPGTIPTTTTTDPTDAVSGSGSGSDEDDFENALLEGMITPVNNPSDASAVVPILVRGPAELGERIRTIQFERTFDPSLVQRADRLLDRILSGIDLPKEVVSGVANIKYANAIVLEESLFRAHIEPLAILICDLITNVYLRPTLQAHGFTPQQANQIALWYDPSNVARRANREQSATTLYDRYALSARALREAAGFSSADAPDPTEIIMRLLVQKGPVGPELAEALMRVLAPNTLAEATDAASGASDNPLPPELLQALGGAPAPTDEPTPTDEPAPAPAPAPTPTPTGPRPGRPSTPGASDNARPASAPEGEIPLPGGISLLPPTPRAPRSTG